VINPATGGLILPIIAVAVPISAPLAQILMRSMDRWRFSRLSPSPAPRDE
jgi:hypothetical protein